VANIFSWLAPYATIGVIILGIIVLALMGVVAWQTRRLGQLQRHYQSLLEGTNGGNLQSILDCHLEALRSTMYHVVELETRTGQLEQAGRGHVQHIEVRRFNPFRETGGDQSFVLALTDVEGNGAVLSSLHSRDVTRVYAKPVANWTSVYPLTDEEIASLNQARQK
jgi:hypothetical protein